ncbi:MAG: penicillin-binding transpeptidase domain-containing protein, partial [Candidatus Cloacimonetes bacterium]|nr:penicillin-binding transpeptidase domain-containing protein [Candidatus Cloacimonadota bacterium]
PILYSTAIDKGYTPATVIKDEPLVFIQGDSLFWKIRNYGLDHSGYIRLRDGLKRSTNVIAAKIIYDIGPREVVKYAKKFGISTPLYPVYSLAVGACEVKPIELISAYTTFPNNGERVNPVFVKRVEDKEGNIIYLNQIERVRVLDEKTSYIMTNLLQSVVEEGTAAGVRWRGYKWTGAGKTGTTDDFKDAWFIGFNKELVTGIWVGFDDNTTLGKGQSGSTAALPAWPYIMKYAVERDAPVNNLGKPIVDGKRLEFSRPEGISTRVISKETGLLPKNQYEETMLEFFITNTEPTLLSDSLRYNFYPTIYRESDADSLVIDLGGRPLNLPRPFPYLDLRGAKVIKDRKLLN